jgi:hypothetical protein
MVRREKDVQSSHSSSLTALTPGLDFSGPDPQAPNL